MNGKLVGLADILSVFIVLKDCVRTQSIKKVIYVLIFYKNHYKNKVWIMKKIIFSVVLMLVMSSSDLNSANVNYNDDNLTSRIEFLSNSILKSQDSSMNPYSLDFNKNFDLIRSFLRLDEHQSSLLYQLHIDIKNEFEKLYRINDKSVREKTFNNIISFWRRMSSMMIVDMTNDETEDISRMIFREYWALVSVTVSNSKIIDEFGHVN